MGVLAVAEPDLLFLVEGEFFRAEAGAFVGAVTQGLVAAVSTGAPPVVSCFEFEGDGFGIVDVGRGRHEV